MSHDIAIGTALLPTVGAAALRKPSYLLALTFQNGKTITTEHFISLDKPQIENGVIQTKGVYTELAEEDIVKDHVNIVSNITKESILEMQFPLHRMIKIRSLGFNANKNVVQQR